MNRYYGFETTLTDEIIAFLLSCRSTRIRRQILWERFKERQSRKNFNQNVYRLQNRGILKSGKDLIEISEKGKARYNSSTRLLQTKPKGTKRIMVIFDIPETKRKIRNWLRLQLKLWDFTMIQKSVWTGKGPLPIEFKERLKALGINKNVKTFELLVKD